MHAVVVVAAAMSAQSDRKNRPLGPKNPREKSSATITASQTDTVKEIRAAHWCLSSPSCLNCSCRSRPIPTASRPSSSSITVDFVGMSMGSSLRMSKAEAMPSSLDAFFEVGPNQLVREPRAIDAEALRTCDSPRGVVRMGQHGELPCRQLAVDLPDSAQQVNSSARGDSSSRSCSQPLLLRRWNHLYPSPSQVTMQPALLRRGLRCSNLSVNGRTCEQAAIQSSRAPRLECSRFRPHRIVPSSRSRFGVSLLCTASRPPASHGAFS